MHSHTLSQVVFDEATLREASATRSAEWLALARDLLNEHVFTTAQEGDVLRISADGRAAELSLFARDAEAEAPPRARATIARDALTRHLTEYVDIVRKLDATDEGYGSPRFAALDMAKKVAHDDAGKTLLSLCEPLGADHATARRLFSLLFSIFVDTTRLIGVHGHRPFR